MSPFKYLRDLVVFFDGHDLMFPFVFLHFWIGRLFVSLCCDFLKEIHKPVSPLNEQIDAINSKNEELFLAVNIPRPLVAWKMTQELHFLLPGFP